MVKRCTYIVHIAPDTACLACLHAVAVQVKRAKSQVQAMALATIKKDSPSHDMVQHALRKAIQQQA